MSRQRILVVDDDTLAREVMQDILEMQGYQVTALEDPRRALEVASKDHFDLLLSDIKMPGMDGVQLIREFRKLSPETVCLLITGYASIGSAREAIQQGVFDYILKPFDSNKLCISVFNALERKRLADESARVKDLSELHKVSQAVAVGAEQDELQDLVMNTAVKQTQSSSGAILLFDAARRGVVIAGSLGSGVCAVQIAQSILQRGVKPWVAEMVAPEPLLFLSPGEPVEKHPLFGRVCRTHPIAKICASGLLEGEVLLLPIEVDKETVGLLVLHKEPEKGSFVESDVKLATILGTQLGLALQSRQLLSQL